MRRRTALLALLVWVAAVPALFAQGAIVAFTHDANGNLTSKTENGVVWTYVYDARNLLREVHRDGVLFESYQYDYQGHRIKKAGPDGVVRYVWDRNRIILETDDFGNTIAKYEYAGDRLLAVHRVTEGIGFYLLDALGSPVAVVKADGSLAARYKLDAWGVLRAEAGSCSNPFLFTGHQFDQETGLYYAGARFYDPQLGRFLTQDPASGKVLEPLSLHRYIYARANPTRFVDPDGREAMEVMADGRARVLSGPELHRILVMQEGLSPEAADRIVILSQLGDEIGADRTAAMTPYILGAGELMGILPAERALASPYVQGTLQVAGGTAEVGLGLAAAGTGAGAVASPVLAAHGGDLIGTGIRTLTSGEAQETLTHRGMRTGAEALGANPSTASFTADLGETGVVGLAGTAAVTALPPRPFTSFSEPSPPPPGRGGAMLVTESSRGGVNLVPVDGPGSPVHRAARWQDYQARGGEWTYERWSAVYEQNMGRAARANTAADAYHQALGWGRREVTVDVEGVPRRLDVADEATLRGREFKTGAQYATEENLWEIQRDQILREKGWDIQWYFEGTASKPLREALERAGIPYTGGKQ